MKAEQLIKRWFALWAEGKYEQLPITSAFEHTSPFGTIDGREAYLGLVEQNKDKFLGYSFEIHDSLYGDEHACVRYTARQGEDFRLDVSEWYYIENGLIDRVVAYYHIGDILKERELRDSN